MHVTFVALQTNGKQTREKELFDEYWSLIFIGKRIKSHGTLYQVTELEWTNRAAQQLKAICKEFKYPGQK